MAVPVNTTIQTQIANLYIAILGRNPEPAGFAYWTDNLANNNGTAQALQNITLAFSNSPEFVATYGGQTTAAAVGLMYTNVLNRTADAGGLAYWEGIANGYIASGYTIAQAYALTGNAIATAAAANTGTADATLMATKQAAAIASGTAAPTTTYTLTTGVNNITAAQDSVIFNAPVGALADGTFVNTLETFDELTGLGGTNQLNATLIADAGTPILTNIQNLYLQSRDDTAALSLENANSVAQVWTNRSTNDLTITGVQNSVVMGVNGTTASVTFDLTYANDASDGAQSIVLQGAGCATNVVTLNATDAGTEITEVSINAVSGTNSVILGADMDLTEILTITGSAALEIDTNTTGFTALTSLAAGAYTGDLEIDISGGNTIESVETGSGNDVVTIDGETLLAAAVLAIDLGTGANTLTLTNIDDEAAIGTLVFTGDDLTVQNVDILNLNDNIAITADESATIDLDGIAPSAVNFAGTVDLDSDAVVVELSFANTQTSLDLIFEDTLDDAGATGNAINLGADVTSSTVTFGADVGATNAINFTGEVLESFIMAVNGDGVTINTFVTGLDDADTDALTSLTLSDTSEAGDATIVVTVIDTLNLTSITLIGGEATDFTLDTTDVAFESAVTYYIGGFGVDADGVAVASDIITDAAAVREIFAFNGSNIADIVIDGYTQNAGANGDRIDFSSFAGISGLADLDFEVDGGDTLITSDAFDGTITIVGVDIAANAYNFVF